MVTIRPATMQDADTLWSILSPVLQAGETYTLPTDIGRQDALEYWFAAEHEVFVAEEEGAVLGTYFLRANQKGRGAHVANCGYMTTQGATGRGVARTMCLHSLERARSRGFRAMQFNFVVSTNERALKLWKSCGFSTVGCLPKAFRHPQAGYVDAYVMFREL